MSLLKFETSNVLRHLKYPIQGLAQQSPAGQSLAMGNMGMRFLGVEGGILYRLNQIAPDEQARLAGRAYGAVNFPGINPTTGDTVTITLSGGGLASPVAKTVTITAVAPNGRAWTTLMVAATFAQYFALDPAFQAAGFVTTADYGAGPFNYAKTPAPIVSFGGPAGQTGFTLAVSFTGNTPGVIIATGGLLSPSLAFTRVGQVYQVWGYLPICDYLESQFYGATANLSLTKAEEVTFRSDELGQRRQHYMQACWDMATFLGYPVGQGPPSQMDQGPITMGLG